MKLLTIQLEDEMYREFLAKCIDHGATPDAIGRDAIKGILNSDETVWDHYQESHLEALPEPMRDRAGGMPPL